MVKKWDEIRLQEFLIANPMMAVTEHTNNKLVLSGTYHLCATTTNNGDVDDDYNIKVEIPSDFPHKIPIVRETGGKIPRDEKHHVNSYGLGISDSLCLGSSIRVLVAIAEEPTISGFVNKCVAPLLYGVSVGSFVFGELAHGARGIFDDYKEQFGFSKDAQIIEILFLLSKKKRIANKFNCPCGCGKRLGRCKLHNKINYIRKLSSRKCFRDELNKIISESRNAKS